MYHVRRGSHHTGSIMRTMESYSEACKYAEQMSIEAGKDICRTIDRKIVYGTFTSVWSNATRHIQYACGKIWG